ncbi:MAG: hypothetical protein Q4A15_12585, partial [Prevotellaceae bacterium]|nr:hypothetical protein [Prevotellaceae bacterium]
MIQIHERATYTVALFFIFGVKRGEHQIMYDHIEHHGIKGQRWGIRRTPELLGHDRKRVKDMSDD